MTAARSHSSASASGRSASATNPPSRNCVTQPASSHETAYDHVVKEIGVPAARIVFFDDSADNIEGARARGLVAVHVTSTRDVADALAALGI